MKRVLYIFVALLMTGTMFAQNVSIEFRVDMSVAIQEGEFTTDQPVKLAGTFNNWNNGATVMTDTDGDSIYTVKIDTFTVGQALEFKFIKGADGWEGTDNRQYTVPSGNSVYTAYWENDSVVTLSNTNLTFSVNMEFEIVSHRFNPAEDTLTVRGSFNGWSGTDIMHPSATDANFYELTVPYPASVNEEINYKYAFIDNSTRATAWEGDPNKVYTVTQADIDAGAAFIERTFNDLTLDNVTNNEVTITFVVNVNGATSSVTGQPFPSIDRVMVAGAVFPLQWPIGGWPDADSNIVHFMYNDGTHGDAVAGDSLWSVNLTFPQYSPLRIQYKYGANWGLPSNTGSNDNESSVGTDHFINLTSKMVSGTVRNQWSVMGDHEIVNPVGVKEVAGTVPTVYSLSQNYPNPFNPVTNIQFSVPEAGLVTVKVYNLIGQEVATLVNEYKNAGTFNIDFNAANLTSGVYFYSIKTSNFNATKKMILMK